MKGMSADEFKARYGYDPRDLEYLDPADVLKASGASCKKCGNADPDKMFMETTSTGYRRPTPSNPAKGSAVLIGVRCGLCGHVTKFSS